MEKSKIVENEGEKHHDGDWGGWGGYMSMKKRKLDEQFDALKNEEDNGELSSLFHGVVIFVNGYTVPSSDELKKLMKKHGGGFQHYYSRSKCSHIVATNLPDSKIKELRNEKVVHPNWIMDSIKEGKVLPYKDYLLYGSHGKFGESNSSKGILQSFIKPDMKNDSLSNKECQMPGRHEQTATNINEIFHDKHKTLPKAGDPNFITEFYNNSRLHYLSTWGAEFKDYINNLIATTELKPCNSVSVQSAAEKQRVIMHIDMDCFFVSVALKNKPELKGLPVAVCHAGRGTGTDAQIFSSTAEIASCSYEARALGLHNGMWLGDARKLCPDLICVPYEFEEYREISQKLYEILARYTHDIQAVSCDEAFVDITNILHQEGISPLELAQCIRNEIFAKTKCPASAGIASNILLARLSTKVAKPNGQFWLEQDKVQQFIGNQKVSELPGVGYSLNAKLKNLNVVTCHELQRVPLHVLRKTFGQKTGEMLYKYCRGEDDKQLKIERERKSISAEINYGIRFEKDSEVTSFITDLSSEVHRRLKAAGVKGKHLTFKLKVRQKDAPINPTKFMGCGRCDSHSKSTTFPFFTDDPNVIFKECMVMLKQIGAPISDMRGMGIQISKLSTKTTSTRTQGIRNFMRNSEKIPDLQSSSEHMVTNDGTMTDNMVPECETDNYEENEFSLVLTEDTEIEKSSHTIKILPQTRTIPDCHQRNSNLPPLPVFSPPKNPFKKQSISETTPPQPSTNHRSPTSKASPRRTKEVPSAQRSLYSVFQTSPSKNTSSNMILPSPSQIDPVVFDALPQELKQDIKNSYRQRNQRFHLDGTIPTPCSSKTPQELLPGIDQEVFEALPEDVKNEIKHSLKTKNVSRKVPQKSERKMLKQKKPAGKQTRTIKKYASSKQDISTVPGIDPSVLSAFPDELKHEIQTAYEQQIRHDQKEKEKQYQSTMVVSNTTTIRHHYTSNNNHTMTAPFSPPKVSLAGAESLSDIREMLRGWIKSSQVPLDEDIGILVNFFETLIFQKDLEKIWIILKFFRRLVSDLGSWQPSFNTVLCSLQTRMKESYGSNISIDYFTI